VGPRTGLEAVSKRKIPSPGQESNPVAMMFNNVTFRTEKHFAFISFSV